MVYQNNLVFKNTFLQSVQFEIPIKITLKQSLNTNLLFFYDYAISSNNYKSLNYKLKGYGFGLSIFKNIGRYSFIPRLNILVIIVVVRLTPWGWKHNR